MFNIRTTQPSVSMEATAGSAVPKVSPEKTVWEKFSFFPQENHEEV